MKKNISKYTPEYLMTLFDKYKLEILEEIFEKTPQGLSIIEFITLMDSVIKVEPVDRLEFFMGLKNLYEDIDVNNDKTLEWKEFTQYIIDSILSQKKLSGIVIGETGDEGGVENGHDARIIEKGYSSSNFRFFHNTTLTDTNNYDNREIRKLIFDPNLGNYLIMSETTKALVVLDERFKKTKKIDFTKLVINVLKEEFKILDFDVRIQEGYQPGDDKILGVITDNRY